MEKTGFPPVAARSSSSGVVRSVDRTSIPEGIYQLYAEDGELIRVKSLGIGWVVLASLNQSGLAPTYHVLSLEFSSEKCYEKRKGPIRRGRAIRQIAAGTIQRPSKCVPMQLSHPGVFTSSSTSHRPLVAPAAIAGSQDCRNHFVCGPPSSLTARIS